MTFRNNNAAESGSSRTVLSVSRLNEKVQVTLERSIGPVWVEGEISNFVTPQSGHSYFSLKDDDSQVRCAIFRMQNQKLNFKPTNGDKVVAYGRVSLYAARGEYQLIIESMEPLGSGALQMRFEKLKSKLFDQGLFDTTKKLTLPAWPETIGVVTSPSGAAIRDILTVLKRRCPAIPVIIYPTAVQGSPAIDEIVHAIENANKRKDCDLLIVSRGGGSLEDLWVFNEELVALAVSNSKIPVVSGVGHEKDITICDLVADVRAATPSAAAEIASPNLIEWSKSFNRLSIALHVTTRKIIKTHQLALKQLNKRLVSPKRKLEMDNQKIDDLTSRLTNRVNQNLSLYNNLLGRSLTRLRGKSLEKQIINRKISLAISKKNLCALMKKAFTEKRLFLAKYEEVLSALGPMATLQRGYAIVTTQNGEIIRKSSSTLIGESIITHLREGTIKSKITDAGLTSEK